MQKIILAFLILLVFNSAYSQQKEIEKIDSLLILSELNRYENGLKSLEYAKKALDFSKEIKDKKSIIKSTIALSYQLYILNSYRESLAQIAELEKEITIEDPILKSGLLELKYVNYNVLQLDDLTDSTLEEYISTLENIDTDDSKQDLVKGYFYKAYRYEMKNDFESADKQIDKALKIDKTMDLYESLNIYIRKSQISIELGKFDTAQVYIQKALKESEREGNETYVYILYELQGDYYFKRKMYPEAIEAYQKTLDEIEKYKMDDLYVIRNTKLKLSDIYGALGDKEKQENYREEGVKYDSVFIGKQNEGLQQAVRNILENEEQKTDTLKSRNKLIVIIICIISLVIIILLCYFYLRSARKKRIVLQQKESLLVEKSALEKQKESLSKKAEENQLGELISLAKSNSPEFIILLEELYPDFVKQLKSLNPKISNSELHFCGLAFLNYSTKEISEFTFVTVAAVQLRKHRLRKKYEIPSEKDFNAWMRELNTSE